MKRKAQPLFSTSMVGLCFFSRLGEGWLLATSPAGYDLLKTACGFVRAEITDFLGDGFQSIPRDSLGLPPGPDMTFAGKVGDEFAPYSVLVAASRLTTGPCMERLTFT